MTVVRFVFRRRQSPGRRGYEYGWLLASKLDSGWNYFSPSHLEGTLVL